jgi:anti-sigma factor ChrR (cupin superfamily)
MMNDQTDDSPPLPDELMQRLAEALDHGADAPPPALRSRLLARARRTPPRGLQTVRAGEGDWRVFLPGVHLKPLAREGDTLTYLLRLDPGAIVVPHEHPQDEECIVLAGEAHIGDLVLRAGDYHLAPQGVPHDAVRSTTGALLFLRGAIPAFGHIRWGQFDTLKAITPGALRALWPR